MATSIPFTFATPVTSYQQGMQAGDQLQQNALALAQQRQDVSDQNALRQALPSIYTGTPDDQQNALKTLAQTAPNKVPDFNSQLQAMNAQQQQATIAKAQAAMQDLGSLVAIPDGPQREQAYQAVLDREQAQGLDVSQLRGMPANQGIRTVFMKAQTAQQLAESLKPQTVKLGANEQQISTDPLTGKQTILSGGGEEKYVNDYNTGRIDPSTGQPILAQGFVGPNGFRPIGLAGSPSSGASGAGGYPNPGGLFGAVQTAESNNNPNAVSPAGARSLMQLLPSTAANPGFGITPAKDDSPEENQRVGQQYLLAMLGKYNGNVPLALAAYNAGPGTVDQAIQKVGNDPQAVLSVLKPETQAYVPRVLSLLQSQGSQVGAQAIPQAGPVNVSDSVPTTATVAPDGTMTAVAQANAVPAQPTNAGLPAGFYTKAPGKEDQNVIQKRQGELVTLKASGVPVTQQQEQAYLATGKLTGDEDAPLSPGDEAMAEKLSRYQLPASAYSITKDSMKPIVQRAIELNPNWNYAQYSQNQKTLNDLASSSPGTSGGTVVAANAALGHLNKLADFSAQLPDSNTLFNYVAGNASKPFSNDMSKALKDWDTAKLALAGEYAKMLKTGAPAEKEIQAQLDNLSPYDPNRNEALATIADFMGEKIKATEEARDRVLGPMSPGTSLYSSDAQKNAKRVIGLSKNYSVPQFLPVGGTGDTTSAGGQATGQTFANAPSIGTVSKGYRYNGGDPSSPTSWTKAP